MKEKLLIVGKIPPPAGGVGMHNLRLIQYLSHINYPYKFIYLNFQNFLKIPFILYNYKIIHLQSSNLKIQYIVCKLANLFNVISIVTFHGDLNRFKDKDASLIKKVIKNCNYPIVLNDSSYDKSIKYNKNTLKISAFIPPQKSEKLDNKIIEKIASARKKGKVIYSTSAYGFSRDKFGTEIYGIIDLINHFNNKPNCLLIISDSKDEYNTYINNNKLEINPENIMIINTNNYFEVLKLSDASIRNTSTDGDSLSVRESIFLGKFTFATDVVSRPKQAIIYQRGHYDFDISNINKPSTTAEVSGLPNLIKLYDAL